MLPYYLHPGIWWTLITGKNLKPWKSVLHIGKLNLDELKKEGVEGVIFDVDNTLTTHHGKVLHPDVKEAYIEICEKFKVAIFSNCGPKRHSILLKMFSVPVIENSKKKPRIGGFLEACKILKLPTKKVVMIGDRLLTDINGGNRAGLRTIRVSPFPGSKEPWLIHSVRKLEELRRKSARD